ncbi:MULTISPECIES: DUF3846 domain-containing protein [unclassified Curtobacterium]|uniref:DUF3846 domain-containing protein n=1 Tax=unclassified Curtobacterium TaxID=257496 RepID=UPI00188B2486|nr:MULTISPECIES: DUF3846 domain-containing protein [unclassified Curtobacterium]MBF4592105.1 DUF3846 domain-containing protein [Curtobacterium sp. VKM Ac-1395]MCY1692902.1 DUF3846 domain-containing protein [Curtobacterium sp. SL109]
MNVRTSVLAGLQAQIGCGAVDVAHLPNQIEAWVDDNGAYTAEVNAPATVAAVVLGRPRHADPLYGPVVFLTSDRAGEVRSLSPDQYKAVMAAFEQARAALTRAEALLAALSR